MRVPATRRHRRHSETRGTQPLVAVALVLAVSGCSSGCASNGSVTLPTAPASARPGVLSVLVPDVVGLGAADARGLILSSGFDVQWSQPVDEATAYIVVTQQPSAGETAPPGTSVRLEVTRGEELSDPALITPSGLSLRIARLSCDQHGRESSPYGWMSDFAVSSHVAEGDGLYLQARVSLTQPDGAVLERTADCLVGGDDIVPVVELFWVH